MVHILIDAQPIQVLGYFTCLWYTSVFYIISVSLSINKKCPSGESMYLNNIVDNGVANCEEIN